MTVPFQQFPANWKVPLYWVEVDNSMAGLPADIQPALLVGQKLASGLATPNVPIAIGTVADAEQQFGIGSMLAQMFAAFMNGNPSAQMWGLPIPDPVGGVAAHGTITVTQPPTQPGTLSLYIAGQKIQIAVQGTETTAVMAQNIETAINAVPTMPVNATIATNVVTLTCKWLGASGNDVYFRDTYMGMLGGEQLPVGMVLTYSTATTPSTFAGTLAGGTGVPVFTAAIASLADEQYEYVAMPYSDVSSILAWDAEYGFSSTGRWGWMRQQYGMVFTAHRDTYANLMTWGANNNSPVVSAMDMEPDMLTPIWEVTAAYCAKAAIALLDDPGRPLQTLLLTGVLGAPKNLRFTMAEMNNFTQTGIATQRVSSDNVTPMILRDTTMYQVNLYGQSDDSYELLTTLATLAAVIRNQRQAITSKYPRHKLADDGTLFGIGAAIITPTIAKAELIAEYAVDEYNGLVQDATDFKNNLIVERNALDPNRLDVLYPPQLINQLRIFAVLAQFRLRTPVTTVTA
jgi:phage tail sheath gpL-like